MGNLFSWTTTGDLQAMQKMIDHVNHTVESDFDTVKMLASEVKQSRDTLDSVMTEHRTKLAPSCKAFADSRQELFHGVGGQPPLSEDCLEAQGKMKTMLALDFRMSGCSQACAERGSFQDMLHWNENLWCDHGPCQSTLQCARQLEGVLAGSSRKARLEDTKTACSTQGFSMYITPPQGLRPPDDGIISMCGDKKKAADGAAGGAAAAAPAQSSMAPAVVAACMLQLRSQRPDEVSLASHVLKGHGGLRRHRSEAGQVFL